jgi:transposase
MRYAQINSNFVCGIDLHARQMYACVMNRTGEILFHRNMRTDFYQFKKKMQPFLPDLSVGVESTHMYYWLADACRKEGIPFYLGHAYYMKTIHGGKTKTDRLDCRKIADLMRTNYYPLAYAYPEEMRATRDLLRRRHRLSRLRAECYRHINSLFHQQGIDVNPRDIKSVKTRRELIRTHLDDDIFANAQTDLDMIDFLDPVIKESEQKIRAQAKCHDRASLNILMSVPGIGDIFSLIILYEVNNINRFTSHQHFCSYARLVRCERSSAGKHTGGGNSKIGNPYLKWAIADIIIHAASKSKPIGAYYKKLQSRFGKRKAKSIISHKFGIAIYYMLKNKQVFDEKRFVLTNMK